MSAFHGKYYKGAMRDHRTNRYRAAVGRQLMMHDRGYYHGRIAEGSPIVRRCTPAPVEEFLRPGDAPNHTDFRSWVVAK